MAGVNSNTDKTGSKRPTLTQVAKRAGVKVSTASEILNNKKNCWASAATRKRVFDAAAQLKYRPNLAARALRIGSTFTIGLITVGLSGSNRIYGLHDAAMAKGYTLMINFNPNQSDREEELIRHQLDRGIDALAIYPAENGTHKEVKKLVNDGFPVVSYDGLYIMDFDCDDVYCDCREVGQMQLEHLLEIGRKRIAVTNTIPCARVNQSRHKRIAELLEQHGHDPYLDMAITQPNDKEIPDWKNLYEQIISFVRKNKGKFDAVIGYDSLASLTVRALLEEKIKVPEEVAVIGSGNSMLATHGAFPLTSIDTDDYWLGEQVFNLLFDRINHKIDKDKFRRISSTPKLLVRQSTVT